MSAVSTSAPDLADTAGPALPASRPHPPRVAIVGAGPAGLAAAEVLSAAGASVDVYDGLPSAGRKFLLAGRGGLNLTHSEPLAPFLARYGAAEPALAPWVRAFDAEALRRWAAGLGVETFVGSSGRVFPREMKAAPLLRAWLHRLRQAGVRLHMRHRWVGRDDDGTLHFQHTDGLRSSRPEATVLALGGASWPRLGCDGAWVGTLQRAGVPVNPLQPANCGFDVAGGWSDHVRERLAGAPLKSVAAWVGAAEDRATARAGEFVLTATGVEGSLVYALSAPLREALLREGQATLWVDLLPALDAARVHREVSHPRGARSLASHLASRLKLPPVKRALLHEHLGAEGMHDAGRVAAALKALPIRLSSPRPVAEAISTAGGVAWAGLDRRLMLRAWPGVFCAGEMLDWEAPTGGYLLTACFATGRAAGQGVMDWWRQRPADAPDLGTSG